MIIYDLISKDHQNNYIHVIKIQTKQTNDTLFDDTVNYLLENNIDRLNKILELNKTLNCVGEPTYQHMIHHEIYNKHITTKFSHLCDKKKNFFCVGTMFYTKVAIMDKIIEHMKEPKNYKMYLLNNMYDNNTFFYMNSPVHFLERFFGNVKI
jgi:hypothetical protein